MAQPMVTIIGVGALGRAFVEKFKPTPYDVTLFNRTRHVGIEVKGDFPKELSDLGDVTFLSVSDRAIKEIVEKLATTFPDLSGKIIAHNSGAIPSAILTPLKERGASIAAFHPLQTFSAVTGVGSGPFNISIEGDEQAINVLSDVAKELGANALILTAEQKVNLHIAAVMACNFLVTLLHRSEDLIQHEDGIKLLEPLIRQTIENVFRHGAENALTGPIARGDIEVIDYHLSQLPSGRQHDIYRFLSLETANLALETGKIDSNQYGQIVNVIAQKVSEQGED